MDKELFFQEIKEKDLSFIASKWLIERVPFIFNENFDNYINWKEELAEQIDVDSRAITMIGSACVGFSLNPNKNFHIYNDESDIDIAIISQYHFDQAWHFLRGLGADFYKLEPIIRNSIIDHRQKYIYWGTIATNNMLAIFPFGKLWTISLSNMAKIPPTEDRDIRVRVYRDFDSLRAYHIDNLEKIRNSILEGESDG
jgi:hypothetical protein